MCQQTLHYSVTWRSWPERLGICPSLDLVDNWVRVKSRLAYPSIWYIIYVKVLYCMDTRDPIWILPVIPAYFKIGKVCVVFTVCPYRIYVVSGRHRTLQFTHLHPLIKWEMKDMEHSRIKMKNLLSEMTGIVAFGAFLEWWVT